MVATSPHQPLVAGGEIGQFARDAADVAQTQHRAPADRAAFRLDRAPAQAGERHGEAAALAAQHLDRRFHALGRRRLQPAAEGEHALRHAAAGQDRGVAENGGHVAGRRPFHQHLRLGQQQRAQPVDLGVQRRRVVARGSFQAVGEPARAQQHQHREHGEDDESDGERERGDVLPAERGRGAAHRVADGAQDAGLGAARAPRSD